MSEQSQVGIGYGFVGTPVGMTLTGIGGAQYVDIRPPTGEIWTIASCNLTHDGAAAHVLSFHSWDGTTDVVLAQDSASTASGIQRQLYALAPGTQPIWITNGLYLRGYSGDAIGGAEHIFARLLVYKLRGMELWSVI